MLKVDQSLLDRVCQLTARVGDWQLSRFRQLPPGQGDQKQAREFVSSVDLTSEQMLLAELQQLVPEAGFFAEESGKSGSESLCWVVDPLDGTTNFLSGLDQFSISVALLERGKPVLGVVYRPASGDCFRAVSGGGLRHNDRQIGDAGALELTQSLIGTGFPYRSPDMAPAFFPCAQELLYQCRGIRRMGSAALDLSYVACGYLQGFWETDLQPYDVAAGLLFLAETGCLISNEQGQPWDMQRDRLLICGWPAVQPALQQIVSRHYQPLLAGG